MALIQQFTVLEGTSVPFSVAGDREVRLTVFDSTGGGTAYGEINRESAPTGQGFYVSAWTPVGRVAQIIITLNHGQGERYTYTALSGDHI